MDSQTSTLLVVVGILLLIYFVYNKSSSPIHNQGSVNLAENALPENMEYGTEMNPSMPNAGAGVPADWEYTNIPTSPEDANEYLPQRDYAPPESDWLKGKFSGRNRANSGYKRSSYSGGLRGNLGGPSDWTNYFDAGNSAIANSQTGENDQFLPVDESSGGLAVFRSQGREQCGSNQNCSPENLFKANNYLPKEVNDDWWELVPEAVSVKNRHLINITRPIGINTIGQSLKNASHDIRGSVANPKYVTSPWLNSSIEPDINLKPLY